MKQETRGRKPKMHKPIPASFDAALLAIAKSKYKPEDKRKKRHKRP